MIQTSTSLVSVIKSIYVFDDSILCRPKLLKSLLQDYYIGPDIILEDFNSVVNSLHGYIANQKTTFTEITGSVGIDNEDRREIQTELFRMIFIDRNLNEIDRLYSEINRRYRINDAFAEVKKEDHVSSLISDFGVNNEEPLFFGEEIEIHWKCDNPFRLTFSNRHEEMDVTGIDSIDICAMFDNYDLMLYDRNNQMVEQRTINITYIEHAFCNHCGTHIHKVGDRYCTECGMKLSYESKM